MIDVTTGVDFIRSEIIKNHHREVQNITAGERFVGTRDTGSRDMGSGSRVIIPQLSHCYSERWIGRLSSLNWSRSPDRSRRRRQVEGRDLLKPIATCWHCLQKRHIQSVKMERI